MARKRRPLIDYSKLTDRQKWMQTHANELHAGIALDQHVGHERALETSRDTFDDAIAECSDARLHRDIFSLLGRTATSANAKRIAAHPECPEAVRKEIEHRISGNQTAVNAPSAPTPAKENAASGEASPDPNE